MIGYFINPRIYKMIGIIKEKLNPEYLIISTRFTRFNQFRSYFRKNKQYHKKTIYIPQSIIQKCIPDAIPYLQCKTNWHPRYNPRYMKHISTLRNSMNIISTYQYLSPEYIEARKDSLNWSLIIQYQNLSMDMIEKYLSRINNWTSLIKHSHRMSEDFIKKYINVFKIKNVLKYQKLSEEFLEYYFSTYHDTERFNWEHKHLIAKYQTLSEEFLMKYSHIIPLDRVASYHKLSEDFLRKYFKNPPNHFADKVEVDHMLSGILERQQVSEEFLIEHEDRWNNGYWYGLEVISKMKLSINFIEKYQNILKWELLSSKKLSPEFIGKFENRIDWNKACWYNHIPEYIIDEYVYKIHFDILAARQRIPDRFIINHHPYITYPTIQKFDYLSTLPQHIIKNIKDRHDNYYNNYRSGSGDGCAVLRYST